jgi:hypothetical protein
VHGARRGFGKHRCVWFEAVHREDLPVIGADVLGEESGAVDAHSLCVGAPTKLSRQATAGIGTSVTAKSPAPRTERPS